MMKRYIHYTYENILDGKWETDEMETPTGDWVKFTDHQAEIAKRDLLLAGCVNRWSGVAERGVCWSNEDEEIRNEINSILAQKDSTE